MQALREYEDGFCPGGCGHLRAEAWSIENDRRNVNHTAHYETGAPYYCAACAEVAKSQKHFAEADDTTGRYWVAQLVPRGLRLAT